MKFKILFILSFFASAIFAQENPEKDELYTKKFRENLEKIELEYTKKWLKEIPDVYLTKWIQNFEYDLDKSENALVKLLDWRQKNNFDKILSWKGPDILKNYPCNYMGYTSAGNIVVYGHFGSWDTRSAINAGHRKDMLKHAILVLEKSYLLAYHRKTHQDLIDLEVTPNSRENVHQNATQAIILADLKDFQYSQMSSIRLIGFFVETAQIYVSYYPNTYQDIIIVNVPGYFSVILDIFKSIASAKALDGLKVFAYDQSQWLDYIEKIVPRHLIPKAIGGDADLIF